MTKIQPDRDPFDFPPNTDFVEYMGVSYKLRELTVAEMDKCREDSTFSDKFDGRLMTRLMICLGSMEPEISMEQLSQLPQRLYSALVDKMNELNDPEALTEKDEKDEGKGKS